MDGLRLRWTKRLGRERLNHTPNHTNCESQGLADAHLGGSLSIFMSPNRGFPTMGPVAPLGVVVHNHGVCCASNKDLNNGKTSGGVADASKCFVNITLRFVTDSV